MRQRFIEKLSRRSVLGGLAAVLLGSTTRPADAAVNVRLFASKSGNKVKVRVRLSGNAGGINFGTRTLGPIYVPRDGKPVTVVFNVLGVVVTVIAIVVAIVVTVVTFGSLAGVGEIFRKTLKKTVPV